MVSELSIFWNEQAKWSEATFGTTAERGPIGPLKHLAKEVAETLNNPSDLEEYADCVFLIFDAARRAGFTLQQLTDKAFAKLEKNKKRIWVRSANPDEPTEHQRGVND